jgi:hypothetical protein
MRKFVNWQTVLLHKPSFVPIKPIVEIVLERVLQMVIIVSGFKRKRNVAVFATEIWDVVNKRLVLT